MSLQNGTLEPLLEKAMQLEKKYEWLQATHLYKEASDLASKDTDLGRTAEFEELMGYCYFRAALQSETNSIFKKRMESSVQAYEKATSLFQGSEEKKGISKADNAKAMVAYAKSWLEVDVSKKSVFLDEWWTIKSKLLEVYEREGDQLAIAKTCNDMMEGSADCRCWLGSDWKRNLKKREELIALGEKAIAILSKKRDIYQLARAYCWTSWHSFIGIAGRKIDELVLRKCLNYAKKALELSEKTEDAWLIGWAYNSLARGLLYEDKPNVTSNYYEHQIKQGEIARDNYLLGVGKFMFGLIDRLAMSQVEDPDKKREAIERRTQLGQEVIHHFQLINLRVWNPYYLASVSMLALASIELKIEKKRDMLRRAVDYGRKSVEEIQGLIYSVVPSILNGFSLVLYRLSEVETNSTEKKQLLNEVLNNTERSSKILQGYPFDYFGKAYNQALRALVRSELSMMTVDEKKKILLLKEAETAIETSIKIARIDLKESVLGWKNRRYGDFFYWFGNIYYTLYLLTKEKTLLYRASEIYRDSIVLFNKEDLITRAAESYWQTARIHNKLGDHLEAAKCYELASKKYQRAAEKILQLKEFYKNHSLYMQAWNQIEKARYNHSKEDYTQAMEHYKEAAFLHEKSKSWSYLGSNYHAWVELEKAEGLSRNEKSSEAIQSFQLAIEYFDNTVFLITKKIKTLGSKEEKEQATNLVRASDLRSRYCQARINLEEAKIFDRKGEYQQSSRSYRKAAERLGSIVDELESDDEKRELRLIMGLSQAWEKMALAEEQASPEIYLEAAQLFEQAQTYSSTKKTSLLILGNSSFCKGLATGIRYQKNLDLTEHSVAKGHLKTAATNYLQAGFRHASEYAKASQRLFDAYLFMNQAESEADPEKRAKQYQMAENLLQISAGSFIKAKQPEKTAQVQQILVNVREEKELAVSLNEVLRAPAIASTTFSFVTPTPTSEVSVGLEQFEHANVQANLISGVKEVRVGESFCLSVEFVNAGREPALLTRVEEFIPSDFVVVKKPEIYRLEDNCLNMKGKQLAPLKLVEAKLVLQPSKKGVYQLKPTVYYLDEVGQKKSLLLKSLEIKVEEVILADRVSTGTKGLDSLLLGGIPEEYAVAFSGSASDEREMIVKNFLKAGTKQEEITFYVTTEVVGLEDLLIKPNFHLFLCNPKPKSQVPDLPNIHRLQGIADLTNLIIELSKAHRDIKRQLVQPKRICVETLSDVLVNCGVKTTRNWISELITNFGSKGFTILAVMNPGMHPSDQANAVLDLFDGEISLFETETATECKTSIQIKRLRNQDYIKNPICLTK